MRHLKLYENFSSDTGKLKDFVSKNSYMEFDNEDDEQVVFATRQNGDVGSERPGSKDVAEAKRLAKLIKDEFNLECEVEIVDE